MKALALTVENLWLKLKVFADRQIKNFMPPNLDVDNDHRYKIFMKISFIQSHYVYMYTSDHYLYSYNVIPNFLNSCVSLCFWQILIKFTRTRNVSETWRKKPKKPILNCRNLLNWRNTYLTKMCMNSNKDSLIYFKLFSIIIKVLK